MAERTDPTSDTGAKVRLRRSRGSRRAILVGVVGGLATPGLMYLGFGYGVGWRNPGGMTALWFGVGFAVLILAVTAWTALRQNAWLRGRTLGGPALGLGKVDLETVTRASVQRHRKFGSDFLYLNLDSKTLQIGSYDPRKHEHVAVYDSASLNAIADALAHSPDEDAQREATWLRKFVANPTLDTWPEVEPRSSISWFKHDWEK